jgi:tRNA(Leu) C34 or U34 (ribose-2'-O)-methylase TrmL
MRLCSGADVPLHLIGPMAFELDDTDATREAKDGVDVWEHPDWFAFRDAISRDRCIYFTADARVDYVKAPFKANSVLVFGNEQDGMPARIVEKHRQRCYRLPAGAFAGAVSTVLNEGLRKLGKPVSAPVVAAEEHDEEPNFNVAPPPVPVPALDEIEEEDEVNYNVEQKPRVSPHPGWGPRGGAGRGGAPRGGPKGGAGKPGGPRGGGRPRRGRGGRGKPKP